MSDIRFVVASITIAFFLVSLVLSLPGTHHRFHFIREACDAVVGLGIFLVCSLWLLSFLIDGAQSMI
jgi:hypothetical protein